MAKSFALLFVAAFFWGTSFVAGKYAFDFADPVLIVLLRFMIATAFWCRKLDFSQISSMNGWQLTGISFLLIPATFLLQFIGLHYTSASSAAVMIGFEPLMVVLIGWAIWKERPSFSSIALGSIALIGIVLVIGWPSDAGFFGSALVLLSTVVVAIWVRWSKVWMPLLGVEGFTALTTVTGTFLLVPFGLPFVRNWSLTFSWHGLLALLYLGVGCSLLAGWAWNKGMSRVPANTGGLFLSLEPVFGIIVASFLLQEHLTDRVVAGALLVIAPIIISSLLPPTRARHLA